MNIYKTTRRVIATLLSCVLCAGVIIALQTVAKVEAATTVFTDDFSGGSISGNWDVNQGTWVQSSGVLSLTDYSGFDVDQKAVIVGDLTPGDYYTITAKVRIDDWSDGDGGRAGVSFQTGTVDRRGYDLLFHNNHNTVQWLVEGVEWGPAYTFNWSNDTWYYFKMEQLSGVFYGKVWSASDSEPSDWMYFWNPTGSLTGYPALNGGYLTGDGSHAKASFDDVTVTTSDPMPSPTPAPNDDFANAQTVVLNYKIGSQLGPLALSTIEESEPVSLINGKYTALHSVWFKWVATIDTEVYFDVCDVHTDYVFPYTIAAVYTGTSLDDLTKVAENRKYGYNCARTFFTPETGTTYYFQVSLTDETVDSWKFLWYLNYQLATIDHDPNPAVPVNDNFADATVIQNNIVNPDTLDHAYYDIVDSNGDPAGYRAATWETGEPGLNNTSNKALNSVWWKWTNTGAARTMWIHTCGDKNPDSVVDVYTGTAVNDLTWVAGNDDYSTDPTAQGEANWECNWEWWTSFTTFYAEADTTYYIRTADLSDGSGTFPLYFYTRPTIYPPVSIPLTAPYYYCSNSAGSGRVIDYGLIDGGISEDSWAQCEAWCEANMSQDFSTCQFNQDATRSCYLSKAPVGGMNNCIWAQSPNANPRVTYVGQTNGYLLIPGDGLKATLKNNPDMDVSVFRQLGDRDLYVMQSNSSDILADTSVNFNSNLDWTGTVTGAADINYAKSYIHNLLSGDGVLGPSFDLYVPIPDGAVSNQVWVCPGANSLDAVGPGCDGGEVETMTDPGISQVNIGGHWYWKIAGVTGTGGQSLLSSFSLKDTLTREQVNVASDHDLFFGTAFGITHSGETLMLTFNGNWDLSTVNAANLQLLDDGTPVTLADGAAGDSTWGVAVNNTDKTITFTAPATGDGYIELNSIIELQITGLAAVNPTVAESYLLEINIANEADGGPENGSVTIPIIDSDQVDITGYVNNYIAFDIDTGIAGDTECGPTDCLIYGGGAAGTNYTVDLGELTSTAVNKSQNVATHAGGSGAINSIYLDLTSNAVNGSTVNVFSANGGLVGPNNTIAAVADNNDITINSGLYGFTLPAGTALHGDVALNGDCTSLYCGPTTGAKGVFTTAGAPVDGARVRMDLAVAAAYTDSPGTYTDTLTFIATGAF
jgi:hypothetical protein